MVEDLSRADAIRASANLSIASATTEDAASTIESIWNFYCVALTPTPTQDLTELIVMDSGLSSDLFCKLDWLQDLRRATRPVSMETNAGSIMVNQEATYLITERLWLIRRP